MDIMELKNKPHLSASSIKDYLTCSLSFKFSRIDKIKIESTSDALEFGSCIHKVLAEFYQFKMIGEKLSLEELQNMFARYWLPMETRSDIEYSESDDFSTLLQKGKDLLAAYFEKLPDDDFRVLAIEEPFSLSIEGIPVPIIGVIDLIEQEKEGTIIITDWKTTGKSYANDQIDQDLQLTIYQIAAKANGYHGSYLLRFDCLVKTKTPKFQQSYTTRSELDERKVVKKISAVWEGISKGVFIPNNGHWKCNCCAYSDYCEQWLIGTYK